MSILVFGGSLRSTIASFWFCDVCHYECKFAFERLFTTYSVVHNLQIAYLPIVIYVPALAFNQVTGIAVHTITPIVCLICVFYTSMGGIKAVVWTDVVQGVSMLGALALVAIKGSMDIGGASVVMERAWNSNRLEAPE